MPTRPAPSTAMNDRHRPLDVLVVGAGPTGLTLAGELAARGIAHRIVDAKSGPDDASKALNVQARTLEILAMLGYADALIERGVQPDNMVAWQGDRRVLDLDLAAATLDDSPFDAMLFVSQVDTEAVLRQRLASVGGEIEWSTEVVDIAVDDDRVRVALRASGGELETIRARYVVGCDGAGSVVRKQGGFVFEGGTYDNTYVQADIDLAGDWPALPQVWLTDGGPFGVMPLGKGGRFRVVTTEFGVDPDDERPPPSIEQIIARGREVGVELEPEAVHWVTRYRVHHRSVEAFRRGPLFVAGDAAHIHSPAGGQGMNTGIQDAFNLGWKLAAVLRREAHPDLLDTYHTERYPVARRVLELTHSWFKASSSDAEWVSWLRKTIVPLAAPLLVGATPLMSRLFEFMSQTRIRYHAFGAEGDGAYAIDGGPEPGRRAPDGPLQDATGRRRRVYDLLDGGPTLLCFLGPDVPGDARSAALNTLIDWARETGVDVRMVAGAPGRGAWVDRDGAAHALYHLDGPGVYLIRPDGHVAWRGANVDAEGLMAWYADSPLSPATTAGGPALLVSA